MLSVLQTLKEKGILISDGGWGTFFHKLGLKYGDSPEIWNLSHPEKVLHVAKSYMEAGSDIILTNSFGGHPSRLKEFELETKSYTLNKLAAEISRAAAGNKKIVAGSIGPSGIFTKDHIPASASVYDGFLLQAKALADGGADAIFIETMYSIEEARIAIKAAKEITNLEVICTFTFDKTVKGYTTLSGVSVDEMVKSMKDAGADIIGANCGNGIRQMIEVIKIIREMDNLIPVIAKPNAGLPILVNGESNYCETPEIMSNNISELISAGANIIGGCCGTGPEHIIAIVSKLAALKKSYL